MARTPALTLSPRKRPRQTRSQQTVDAIFQAAIQVLLAVGAEKLTTTRVADRAGVSVGTLYQYYPNKQALLYGVLDRHLSRIGSAVADTAERMKGRPLADMTAAITEAFVAAKLQSVEEACALYEVGGRVEAAALCRDVTLQGQAVLGALLGTASDVVFDDPDTVAFVWLNAMIGLTRGFLEGQPRFERTGVLAEQVRLLCAGYMERAARAKAAAAP